jgi:hypothetical protein
MQTARQRIDEDELSALDSSQHPPELFKRSINDRTLQQNPAGHPRYRANHKVRAMPRQCVVTADWLGAAASHNTICAA